MSAYVIDFQDIDATSFMLVGGKGAHLGELAKLEGIQVPDGFCITTTAFQRVIGDTPSITAMLDRLALLAEEDREAINALCGEIRRHITGIDIPGDIDAEITGHLQHLGKNEAYAVRSSATAEDLPTASFAGQQNTYLNCIGKKAIFKHISMCWASLYNERAVVYRLRHGIDHRTVSLAVVVQKMLIPQAAGVLFTADPITGNRKVLTIDACFGLGEAMVSGQVNADNYQVRNGMIIDTKIAIKQWAQHARKTGGTYMQAIMPAHQTLPVLSEAQILHLERVGRRIEAHFNHPQDIEWCLVDDAIAIVQSRPITTLYPIPATTDQHTHVYISVGHQQMMTDAMKPMGLSVFLFTTAAPMVTAGGRLFVDVTRNLASPVSRAMLVEGMGQHDPLLKDALMTIIAREDVIQSLPHDGIEPRSLPGSTGKTAAEILAPVQDPSIVADLIAQSQASLAMLHRNIQTKTGVDVVDYIMDDIQELKKVLFVPQNLRVIMAAMQASTWINDHMEQWLGEKSVADTLAQSVPHNITAEMGLELLDVADVIRPYPEVIAYLSQAKDATFWDDLLQFHGGQVTRDALTAYLAKYGMRCVGEIDITRTRWSEKPTTLVPLLLSNIKNFGPQAGQRKFEQGRNEALAKAQELIDRLRQLPDGEQKAEETSMMITLMRNLTGYREYPKYAIVSRYFMYRQALLREAELLVQAQVLHEKEDMYYLTLSECREVVRTHSIDYQLIRKRRDEYQIYDNLTPPRLMTSDGEIIVGQYHRDQIPADALPGLAVSAGYVEGRARVIFDIADAGVEEGDILVTTYTDPSWTPLFVAIKGLVTEVGGLMTHGAVIAREYGIPAVVGVEHATRFIQDGQRIRVHGTEGYVEICT